MKQPSKQHPIAQRLQGRNIFLVGMMGSGKTTTGKPLAQLLQYSFVDLDVVIEQLIGKSISEIFNDEGEETFRTTENQVLNEIGQHHSLVVATGGGVVMKSENWGVLHQGIVVWLDISLAQLLDRLKFDLGDRPLLDVPNPEVVLGDLLKKRKPLYAEADLHLGVGTEAPQDVAMRILESLPSVLRSPGDPF